MAIKIIFLILGFSFVYCVRGEFNLTIVHISDFHSHWLEFNENKHDCSKEESKEGKCYGGFARLLSFVRDIRKKEKNVLVLSSGEFFLGRSLYALHGWKPAHALLPRLELDAMSLSNHDFDSGIFELSAFLYGMKFPVLCANMVARNTSFLYSRVNKSAVIDVDGTKVGIVGYVHRNVLMKTKHVESVKFLPEIPALQEEVRRLESEDVDKIIALGHAGYYTDLEIAKKVKGVDIVIGGDSDIILFDPGHDANEISKIGNIHGNYPRVHHQEPEMENDTTLANRTLVLHIPQHGMYVGVLRATFDEQGKIIYESGEPVLLDKSIPQDQDTLDFLQYAKGALEALSEHRRLPDNTELLGKTSKYLDGNPRNCRRRECSFGNFIVDAMLHEFTFHYRNKSEHRSISEQWGPIDAVVFNSGPIKRSIEPGYITIQDILKSVNLGGFIKRIYMSGKLLTDMMENSVKHYDPLGITAPGAFLQVAGLRVEYDLSQPPGNRVKSLEIRCRDCGDDTTYFPVKPYKTYIVGMSSFLNHGRDGFYDHFDETEPLVDHGQFDALLLVEYLRRMYEIEPVLDGRIKFYQPTDAKLDFTVPPLTLGDPIPTSNQSKRSSTASTGEYTSSSTPETKSKASKPDESLDIRPTEEMENGISIIKESMNNLNTAEAKNVSKRKEDLINKDVNEDTGRVVSEDTGHVASEDTGYAVSEDTGLLVSVRDKLLDRVTTEETKKVVNTQDGSIHNIVADQMKSLIKSKDELQIKTTIGGIKGTVDIGNGLIKNVSAGAENIVSPTSKLTTIATTEETKGNVSSKHGSLSSLIREETNNVASRKDERNKKVVTEEPKHTFSINDDNYKDKGASGVKDLNMEYSVKNESNSESQIIKEFDNTANNFTEQSSNRLNSKELTGAENEGILYVIINNLTENQTQKSYSNFFSETNKNDSYFNISSSNTTVSISKTDKLKGNSAKNENASTILEKIYNNISSEENQIRKRSVPEDMEGYVNKTNYLDYKHYLSLVESYFKSLFQESNEVLPAWDSFEETDQNDLKANIKKETEKISSPSDFKAAAMKVVKNIIGEKTLQTLFDNFTQISVETNVSGSDGKSQ